MKKYSKIILFIISLFVLLSCQKPILFELTIEVNPEGHGRTTPETGQLFESGSEVSVEAVPNETIFFGYWDGDTEGDVNPNTFIMDSDKQIAAVFLRSLSGTWTNPDYNTSSYGKIRIIHDSEEKLTWFRYINDFDIIYDDSYMASVVRIWNDDEGNTMYHFAEDVGTGIVNYLVRINMGGNILEWVGKESDYPAEIDSNDTSYSIFYKH